MNFGWWGFSDNQFVIFTIHDHFSCGIFFCLIPLQKPQYIVKNSNAISSIAVVASVRNRDYLDILTWILYNETFVVFYRNECNFSIPWTYVDTISILLAWKSTNTFIINCSRWSWDFYLDSLGILFMLEKFVFHCIMNNKMNNKRFHRWRLKRTK